jgi:hypothetical protein
MTRTARPSAAAWCAALLVALGATQAGALSISLDPALSSIGLNDTVEIALNVSGLVDGAAPSLGSYDIGVAWDASVLQLHAVSFGDPLLGDQLDLSGFGTVSTVVFGAGTVNLSQLSLDSLATLNDLQAGSFTLATLLFELIDAGSTAIPLSLNQVRNAAGQPLPVEAITGATVSITGGGVSAVPEPSAALLWMLGLLVVQSHLRRVRRA